MFERLRRWLSGYDCKLALPEDQNLVTSTSGGLYVTTYNPPPGNLTLSQYRHISDHNIQLRVSLF